MFDIKLVEMIIKRIKIGDSTIDNITRKISNGDQKYVLVMLA